MAESYGRHPNRELRPEQNNFNGLWDAVVVDDIDPEQRGRVKVRVFDLHDEDTPLEVLPWAEGCFPAAFINVNDPLKSGGFFHIPPVDALVKVMFSKGDPAFPNWMGGWFPAKPCITGRENYTSNSQRNALYSGPGGQPACPTWKSLRGHIVEMDDATGELRITSNSGHKVTLGDDASTHGDGIRIEDSEGNYIHMKTAARKLLIRWDGDVQEHFTGNHSVKIEGNQIVEIGGTQNVSVTGAMNIFCGDVGAIDAAKLNLNCQIAQETPALEVKPGDASAGDRVLQVLARLGNTIRKIVIGS
jgi:hypothetical protein